MFGDPGVDLFAENDSGRIRMEGWTIDDPNRTPFPATVEVITTYRVVTGTKFRTDLPKVVT